MILPHRIIALDMPCDRCRADGPTAIKRVQVGAWIRGYFLCMACQEALREYIYQWLNAMSSKRNDTQMFLHE